MSTDDFYELLADLFTEEWREHASCIDTPRYLFFDEEYECDAKTICDGCPVRLECLDSALNSDDGGFRGGLSEKERHSVNLHRQRYAQYFEYDIKAA